MKKYHDVVPGKKPLKLFLLRRKASQWSKAFSNLTQNDRTIQKETAVWPCDTSFLMAILDSKPLVYFIKKQDGLYLSSDGSSCPSLLMSFKSLNAAYLFFSGSLSLTEAIREKTFVMEGEEKLCLSLLRCLKYMSARNQNNRHYTKTLSREA